MFGIPAGLLGLLTVRSRKRNGPHLAAHGGRSSNGAARGAISPASVAWAMIPVVIVLFVFDTLAFYYGRPMMTFGGLVPLILVNLVIVVVLTVVRDRPDDSVTITVLDVGIQESTRTMQSFRDTRVQLRPAGS